VIVTGDKDLLDLNPFRGIAIVTPADYLARET
jgi:predicted nucleic acid-binding protein